MSARDLASCLLLCTLVIAVQACGEPHTVEHPSGEAARLDAKPTWETTLDRVVPCIVSLRMTVPRDFDTESARTTSGTGFIVDAEQGLILTNRHLVMPGPVVADAIFENREEVELEPVYRDPVHDFGFFRFDPSAVRYMEVCELELAPEAARVGAEVRIVGNNAGEQISILQGTLARLDRDAPLYGVGNYNDFNTFYYQAASGTSGGSSGSPVLDVAGRVIALNAGSSNRSASSFFLPLDRVVRALDLVRTGQPVPRGTLEATFVHEPYDELARLALDADTEATVRRERPDGKGLLVVRDMVPLGPAADVLQVGDVLVRIDGALVTTFTELEDALDSHVGQTLALTVDRGGESVDVEVAVEDLHGITPSEYLEISRAVIHPVSYQLARAYNVPTSGLLLAGRGFMFSAAGVPSSVVLLEVGGDKVRTLDDLQAALERHPDGTRLAVRYAPIHALTQEQIRTVVLDRSWYPMRRCRRDDATGLWPCVDAPAPPEPDQNLIKSAPADLDLPVLELPGPAADLATALVMVEYDIPYRIEGMWGSYFRGSGVVVDKKQGLVLVDRDTVPMGLGDAKLTFAGVHRVPGTVEWIHPLHNVAVLRYDPALLGDVPVSEVEFDTSGALRDGDAVWQVGIDSSHQIVVRETTVDRIRPLELPVPSNRPEFRDQNVEAISIVDRTPSIGGVLADGKGRVHALWASFHIANDDNDSAFRGLPGEVIELVLDPLRRGEPVDYRTLGVELSTIRLADARDFGLDDDWFRTLARKDPRRLQVLQVARTFADAPAETLLVPGDLVLGVDGEPVTRFFEVERATQTDEVVLDVLRDGRLESIAVPTVAMPGFGTDRVINWAGALLHAPHIELSTQTNTPRQGVYIALTWYGGPASQYSMYATRRIIEVNGIPTPDLDTFVDVVRTLEDGASARVRVRDMSDQEAMVTLKLDTRFWPLYELRYDPDNGWRRLEADEIE